MGITLLTSHPYISFFHLLVNGFSVMYVHLASVSSHALELCENSLEVRIPASISNIRSTFVIRFTSDARAKGQRAKVTYILWRIYIYTSNRKTIY